MECYYPESYVSLENTKTHKIIVLSGKCAQWVAEPNLPCNSKGIFKVFIPKSKSLGLNYIKQYTSLLNEVGFEIRYIGCGKLPSEFDIKTRYLFHEFNWDYKHKPSRLNLAYLTVIRYLYFPTFKGIIPEFIKLVKSKPKNDRWQLFILAHLKAAANLHKKTKYVFFDNTDKPYWWFRYNLLSVNASTNYGITSLISQNYNEFVNNLHNLSINQAVAKQTANPGLCNTNLFKIINKSSDKKLLTFFQKI